MKLRDYSFLLIFIFFFVKSSSQNIYSGRVLDISTGILLDQVQIQDSYGNIINETNEQGLFTIINNTKTKKLVFFKVGYKYALVNTDSILDFINVFLEPLSINLGEVTIIDDDELFNTTKLNDVEGDAIFAAKKTNKIILKNTFGNAAANSARHVFNKIGGLNIFQNDDAGLQLNIGGRGLNPGRSANFNIRQNNYDISADVLGYPESYYTPPTEALKEIQVVRGAASLQYGTQFGGLVNFVFKQPYSRKKLLVESNTSIGSNNLLTNFTSFSGIVKKLGYYSFINIKSGDGFRENSCFNSINLYTYIDYKFSPRLKSSFEVTYFNYLAQQAGGLTDKMFYESPFQSNRQRNWFDVDWLLLNSKIYYKINQEDNFSINIFALNAHRYSLGYRNVRVDQVDPLIERDLIKGQFNNYGAELRYLNRYKLKNKKSILLSGIKYYKSNNTSEQGPGNSNYDSNFNFAYGEFPYYSNQSYYEYPNLNTAVFLENIIYISNKTSIVPGIRYEFIDTRSEGSYRSLFLNLVNQPIFDTTIQTSNNNKRNFLLCGIGISHKFDKEIELYSNLSQNYRSVTFADISVVNPSFTVDPQIGDESGYSFDIGFRGFINQNINIDVSYFGLKYDNRIGFLQKTVEQSPGFFTVKTLRSNVGNAYISGIESLIDIKFLENYNNSFYCKSFLNYALTHSEYLESPNKNVLGKKVEFVPTHNLKYGINIFYKEFQSGFQLTYLSDQYTDASNSIESNISGTIGMIPSYYIIDFSSSTKINKHKIVFGVNNILNNYYFTRRATGYPGPGIIPSDKRNFYLSLKIKI